MRQKEEILEGVKAQHHTESQEQFQTRVMRAALEVLIDIRDAMMFANSK